ncbi:hypothetical protein F4806DRAFT_322555 [Annulohypoxylon nitens]|nr:hypothetical protein F4806DRAFT_322555 [Annulohypoxylon nitens]
MSTIQSKERRSVSRQFHRKSRNSCLPCRKRHVRCDLRPPTCSNCHRRNELCSYKQQVNHGLDQVLVPTTGYTTENLYSSDSDFFNGAAPLEFVTSYVTPNTIRETNSLQWIWQVTDLNTAPINQVMEVTFFLSWLSNLERAILAQEFDHQANSYNYVHRTIAALYALHESHHGTPHSHFRTAAYRYQIEASILFRNSQIEVNEVNWLAILLFGIGVIVFQFTSALKSSDEDSYMELLYVLRNSYDLAIQLKPHLLTSSFMQFTGPRLTRLKPHLDSLTWSAICSLDSLEYPADTTDETKRACLYSVVALKEWVIETDGYPRNWLHYIIWPAAVSGQYLLLLSQKHPAALVIFVYWCSIMHRSPRRWFMVGWAKQTATVAMRHLGEEWDRFLEFPRKTVGSDFKHGNIVELALMGTGR